MNDYYIHGIPEGISEEDAAVCRSRFLNTLHSLQEKTGVSALHLRLGAGDPRPLEGGAHSDNHAADAEDEFDIGSRTKQFRSLEPTWRLDQLVLPDKLLNELQTAISLVRLEPLVFDAWGLRDIEPFPRSVLNFHGSPGTGKTMTAHAVAADLGKKILVASYAQIESKYHGEGPKNVEALFLAAQEKDAILFIDEADSLLSRRLTNVTQGSEQAINSMRSQILICLERHKGVVIFATNLVENYDPAFETRVHHIHFPMPDKAARAAIWQKHLPGRLPLHADVDPLVLADQADDFCGRDIKNAVINAAMTVARRGGAVIAQADLGEAVARILDARAKVRSGAGKSLVG